jgi:hypothetical protein
MDILHNNLRALYKNSECFILELYWSAGFVDKTEIQGAAS